MARAEHQYAKNIVFYYIPKETFNILLDQIKIISQKDYDTEAEDGFEDLVRYWNDRGTKRIENKIASNNENIKFL